MKNVSRRSRSDIRAAKTSLRKKFELSRYGRVKSMIRRELIPGFRDRLLATIRTLDDVRADEYDTELYVDYLALATGTAVQTARRWIDADNPGLPDLVSFATLCKVFGSDVNWMLGLSKTRLSIPRTNADWIQDLVSELGQLGTQLAGMRVQGDEMEPDISSGDWVLIDTSRRTWGSHGMYAIQYRGVPALRTIGTSIGAGYVLKCSNERYSETLVKDEGHAKALGIKLLGRVTMRIGLTRI